MKLPPFTLVHNPSTLTEASAILKRRKPQILTQLARTQPKLAESLLASTLLSSTVGEPLSSLTLDAIEIIGREMHRAKKVLAVGVWDLETRAGNVPALLEKLNEAQPTFTFFEVQAAIPSGLVSQRAKVVAWAQDKLRRQLRADEAEDIGLNIIADELFPLAERVRTDLGLDYLIAITSSMVAGEDGDDVYWNHFSVAQGRVSVVSTAQVRELAQVAGRPFEAGVAVLMISSMMVGLSPKLGFHENRGCLFDYHGARDTLAQTIAGPQIEERCLDLLKPKFRKDAASLVKAIEEYDR